MSNQEVTLKRDVVTKIGNLLLIENEHGMYVNSQDTLAMAPSRYFTKEMRASIRDMVDVQKRTLYKLDMLLSICPEGLLGDLLTNKEIWEEDKIGMLGILGVYTDLQDLDFIEPVDCYGDLLRLLFEGVIPIYVDVFTELRNDLVFLDKINIKTKEFSRLWELSCREDLTTQDIFGDNGPYPSHENGVVECYYGTSSVAIAPKYVITGAVTFDVKDVRMGDGNHSNRMINVLVDLVTVNELCVNGANSVILYDTEFFSLYRSYNLQGLEPSADFVRYSGSQNCTCFADVLRSLPFKWLDKISEKKDCIGLNAIHNLCMFIKRCTGVVVSDDGNKRQDLTSKERCKLLQERGSTLERELCLRPNTLTDNTIAGAFATLCEVSLFVGGETVGEMVNELVDRDVYGESMACVDSNLQFFNDTPFTPTIAKDKETLWDLLVAGVGDCSIFRLSTITKPITETVLYSTMLDLIEVYSYFKNYDEFGIYVLSNKTTTPITPNNTKLKDIITPSNTFMQVDDFACFEKSEGGFKRGVIQTDLFGHRGHDSIGKVGSMVGELYDVSLLGDPNSDCHIRVDSLGDLHVIEAGYDKGDRSIMDMNRLNLPTLFDTKSVSHNDLLELYAKTSISYTGRRAPVFVNTLGELSTSCNTNVDDPEFNRGDERNTSICVDQPSRLARILELLGFIVKADNSVLPTEVVLKDSASLLEIAKSNFDIALLIDTVFPELYDMSFAEFMVRDIDTVINTLNSISYRKPGNLNLDGEDSSGVVSIDPGKLIYIEDMFGTLKVALDLSEDNLVTSTQILLAVDLWNLYENLF